MNAGPRTLEHPHAVAAAALAIACGHSWRSLRDVAWLTPDALSPAVVAALVGPGAWLWLGVVGALLVLFAFRKGEPWSSLAAALGVTGLAIVEAATPSRSATESLTGVAVVFLTYALASRVLGDPNGDGAERRGVEAALGAAAALLVLDALSPWLADGRLLDAHALSEAARAAGERGAVELRALRTALSADAMGCKLLAGALLAGKLGGLALLVPRARVAYAALTVLGALIIAVCFGRHVGPALVGVLVLVAAASRGESAPAAMEHGREETA